MKVYEIAEKTGIKSGDVASELGVASHLSAVSDEVAEAYMASKVSVFDNETDRPKPEAAKKLVRFWSEYRRNYLPTSDDSRGDIQFEDWCYECSSDSAEAKFLRNVDVSNRCKVSEVIEAPYSDPMEIAGFMQHLKGLIYTGQSEADGPSREGRDHVKSILPKAIASELSSDIKSTPNALIRVVASNVSLGGKSFSM